jgi:Tfp pilus assembly protein PilE
MAHAFRVGLFYGDTNMIDSVNLTHGTAAGSTLLGMVGIATATSFQEMGLSVVAVVGGLLSVAIAAYGNYRKINKEYGVDDIKAMAQQNEKLQEANAQLSAEIVELLKAQNQLLAKLNTNTETVAASTAVSADLAVQQAAKANT